LNWDLNPTKIQSHPKLYFPAEELGLRYGIQRDRNPPHTLRIPVNPRPGSASETTQSLIMDTERPLRILVLDGGGVRGLSEVLILKFLMLRLRHEEQKKTKQRLPDLPSPWKYFDLICGTSTGGLLALMLGRLRLVIPGAFVC